MVVGSVGSVGGRVGFAYPVLHVAPSLPDFPPFFHKSRQPV